MGALGLQLVHGGLESAEAISLRDGAIRAGPVRGGKEERVTKLRAEVVGVAAVEVGERLLGLALLDEGGHQRLVDADLGAPLGDAALRLQTTPAAGAHRLHCLDGLAEERYGRGVATLLLADQGERVGRLPDMLRHAEIAGQRGGPFQHRLCGAGLPVSEERTAQDPKGFGETGLLVGRL